ncbi:recombinase family protein [Streptomonospora sp. DSM 45055]|uniref:Recombinase family protein n=2 Tax=Streptomonospora wellingtoniae TaxID=3075544 RepID=A0ABU2KMW7_9ACTN|nr:recombinase family protein [Streptomonospora sp. DSM 45055]MDT0300614.1 recombinase family protein [Streptomonospora sp. DSM 45055]
MRVLGAQSQREVLAAMRAQTCEQGRYLGGRPPYGYRLVDAGPHPNKAHAKWGRRLQRLDVDPVCAVHVRWIFAERLAGRSLAGIARRLNERGVPCPSGADRERNSHRPGQAWMVPTVAAILANPRYTGRQVWQRSGACSPDSGAGRPGREEWAVSKEAAHPALVSEGEFVAAQAVRKARPTKDGSAREYVFAGLLVCGVCGRRMDAHWINGRAGYRCRHGYSSSRPRGVVRKKSLYVREDRLLEAIALGLPGRDPLGIARYLRANELAVVCDTATWEVVGAEHAKGPSQSDLVEAPEPGQYPLMG